VDRTRHSEPAPQAPTREPAPAQPAAPEGDITTQLLHCQATGGNQMVLRLLAAARAESDDPAGGGAATDGPALADRIRSRLGGGSPLPASVRAEAEAGFGRPLGDVRVHTDAHAATMATQVQAHAFTTGNDIFFNRGVYDPGSAGGYKVLAHELTHTLQQAAGPVAGTPAAAGITVSDVHDADEREAYATADRLAAMRGSHSHDHAPAPALSGGASGGGARASRLAVQPLAIQRHSSWEHTLLGDTPTLQLGDAAVTVKSRKHVLSDLWARMMYFSSDPTRDPRERFPDVRWVQLKASALWVSVGELNALADYLPDPTAADTMPREEIVPVLQKMRSGIRGVTGAEFGLRGDDMHGMASHWMEFISSAGGEVKALDEATAGQGLNRYQGLLSRNACHFAPFSWQRWEQYHNEAIEEAKLHFASRSDTVPIKDVPKDTEEHARQALLKGGYADHFLQDSFAAGHLVNKTLVMQWWVDYLNQAAVNIPYTDYQIVRRGQPDAGVMSRMGSAAQPGVAGRELYGDTPNSLATNTNAEDRIAGTGVTDPQSAQERTGRQRRLEGSGVTGFDDADREANYQAYLRLLNNAQAQGAAGATHDHFNAIGLTVVSADGSLQMRVGGDDTLLSESDSKGALAAAHAAQLSRQAIDEVMNTGETTLTTEYIFGIVPAFVVVDGASDPMPLQQWQDSVLKDLCFSKIFPEYYSTFASAVIGTFGSEMVEGGMSRDSGKPPPGPMGDFPTPGRDDQMAG
jgi:hypothetical protein